MVRCQPLVCEHRERFGNLHNGSVVQTGITLALATIEIGTFGGCHLVAFKLGDPIGRIDGTGVLPLGMRWTHGQLDAFFYVAAYSDRHLHFEQRTSRRERAAFAPAVAV